MPPPSQLGRVSVGTSTGAKGSARAGQQKATVAGHPVLPETRDDAAEGLSASRKEHDMDKTEQIRQHAYRLWQAAGSPEGQDAQHWQEAEEQLREEGKLDEFGPPADLPDLALAPSPNPGTSASAEPEQVMEAGDSGIPDEARASGQKSTAKQEGQPG